MNEFGSYSDYRGTYKVKVKRKFGNRIYTFASGAHTLETAKAAKRRAKARFRSVRTIKTSGKKTYKYQIYVWTGGDL